MSRRAYHAVLPRKVRGWLDLLLNKIAPDVPVSLSVILSEADAGRAFAGGAVGTLVLGLGVVALWSYAAGTLFGTDPGRLYLSKDVPNLVNYALICPLYVGFGCALIVVTVRGWAQLQGVGHPVSIRATSRASGSFGFPILAALILLTAGVVTALYVSEVLDPHVYKQAYWFIERIGPDGARLLGAFGVYYAVLNFWLLALSLLVLALVIAVFVSGMRLGDDLRAGAAAGLSTSEVRERLTTFTRAYIVSKWLAATYMANAFTWRSERPHNSLTFILLGVVLSFFGVFFISFPRYYIELCWFQARAAGATGPVPTDEYEDIRPRWAQNTATVLDALIISGFLTTFWSGR